MVVKDGDGCMLNVLMLVWVMCEDEFWFGGDNIDWIDVIFEKMLYELGEMVCF